jgi:hypothetical protein
MLCMELLNNMSDLFMMKEKFTILIISRIFQYES